MVALAHLSERIGAHCVEKSRYVREREVNVEGSYSIPGYIEQSRVLTNATLLRRFEEFHQQQDRTDIGVFGRRGFCKMLVAATASLAISKLLGSSSAAASGVAQRTRIPLITLFLSGGAPSKETFNPDPAGTLEELRGPMGTVQTSVTGVHFGDQFPRLAALADRMAVIRSLDAGSSDHTPAQQNAVLLGRTTVSEQIGERASDGGVPYVVLNPGSTWYGLRDAFRIGHAFAPIWTGATRRFSPPRQAGSPERLRERRGLLEGFEKDVEIHSPAADRFARFRQTAFDLSLGGGDFFRAFTLGEKEREHFGNTTQGDMALLAKQLVQRGAGAVTVYDELDASMWDTHGNMKKKIEEIGPPMDRAASRLAEDILNGDLNALLLIMGEFNRTPRMNGGGGRDHWSEGNCAVLVGRNIRGGVVHGRVSPQGRVTHDRVSQRTQLANTLLVASGAEIEPAAPRVREVLRAG